MITGGAGSSLSDGRGSDTAPEPPEAKPAHRYIYYRLYNKDGAMESNNPIYSNDRFISRVIAKYVAPPHTGASIKRHLFRIEGFESSGNGTLYLSLSEKNPVEDSARISLRGSPGPGSSAAKAMVLVVATSPFEKRSAASTVDPKTLPQRREEPRFVYYRLYDQGGQVTSKTSFKENDPSLGRIDAHSIPPPHTVSSLRSRLVKVEELSGRDVQLFGNEYGETIMNDGDPFALSSDHYPGITEDEPIATVYESEKSNSAPKLQDFAATHASAFSKQIRVRPQWDWVSNDLAWHTRTAGEIFKTDGILRTEKYNSGTTVHERPCYVAINSAGKKAFLHSSEYRRVH